MFGREYALVPEVLLKPFNNWEEGKEKELKNKNILDAFKLSLIKGYIAIFGIPHIGSQLRFIHFRKMIESIPEFSPKKILDAGCGIGFYSFWLNKRYPLSRIKGYDIDKKKISFCKRYSKKLKIDNADFFSEDILNMRNKKDFDLVISIDVLEHIRDHKVVLANFYSLLSKGGYLYIHVPCEKQKLFFKEFSQYHYTGHVVDGFNLESLKKDMKKTGFKVIKTKNTFGTFGTLAWETNHWALAKNLFVAGFTFPLLYILAKIDLNLENKSGCGIALLAQKI